MSTFLSILPIIIALVLYFTGIPIAYALFAAALTYFGFIDTTTMPYLLMQKFVTATQSFPFLAIPFFIMCGSIMNYGGISARLMDFADALTGHMRGGLAQINVLLSMLMGGCSGSANADAAMECKLLVPEMEKRGYGKGFSAAITAASSCVTPIIPPGINLIVYGLIAGASVGQLFAAGYVPGLLMAVALMIAVAWLLIKKIVRHPLGVTAGLFILGGGLGNMIDRVWHGYVVDMLDISPLLEYPVFNLADCFVVVGAVLGAVYYLWFYDKYDKKEPKDDAASES